MMCSKEGYSMPLYTIGSGGKTAREFFELLKNVAVRRVIDIRLHNTSQLAGFTKKDDLAYFLSEICSAEYLHETRLSPTDELMEAYKKREIGWAEYSRMFNALLAERNAGSLFDRAYLESKATAFLCSEPKADHCHRRLVAEFYSGLYRIEITHL
jgi:uncharacterized protein (DUF488 family)